MKLICETELMANQTHATLMTPGGRFRALRTQEGTSLFFSLGTDSVLYLTSEASSTKTGWSRLDLSSAIAPLHPGSMLAARVFEVSQNIETGHIDLAVAMHDGVTDHLYVSQGNANTDSAWAKGITWQPVPYDASESRPILTISDLYLLQTSAGFIGRYFMADVTGQGGRLFRYFIDPDKANFDQHWTQHFLPADAQVGSVTSCMGKWPNDDVAGIYTFGQIDGTRQLQYQRTVSSEVGAPAQVYKFALPDGASAITTTLDANGNSHFFVAADATLHFYPPEQNGMQVGTPVVSDPFFAGVSQIHAAASAGRTVVWGINQDNHLAYMHCPAGSEADTTAWSSPARILDKVQRIAPFLNVEQDNATMFAHRSDATGPGAAEDVTGSMVKFTQDSVTTAWTSRGVPLPTSALDHMVEYQSFTTHVRVTDDQNISVPNAAVTVTAISPVTISANGASHVLSPNVPLILTADVTGVMTIVQETASLAGTCLDITATMTDPAVATAAPGAGIATATAPVRPMQKSVATLRTIQSGSDLAAVKVSNPDGSRSALLPSGTSSGAADATAQLVQKLVTAYDSLPADGAKKAGAPTQLSGLAAVAHMQRAAMSGMVCGVFRDAGGLTYCEGQTAMARLGLLPGASAVDPATHRPSLWGDIFAWLKFAWHEVESFVVSLADGIYTFVIKVGELYYHMVVDCIYAVGHALEYAFKAIAVAFEDLVKWVGFIFNWGDIVRTHKVLRNIIRTYSQKVIGDIPQMETAIERMFADIDQRIDAWAKLPGPTGLVGGATGQSTAKGQDHPQSHWALHHMKNNLSSAAVSFTTTGGDGSVLTQFAAALDAEKDAFTSASKKLQALFSGHIPGLTLADIFKAVVGILAELILTTMETIIQLGIKVMANFVSGIAQVLDAVIDIPIISSIYKDISGGDPLTVLDLAALIVAIPVTIVYKFKADAAPYPDNALTSSLISAKTFADIRTLINPSAAPGLLSSATDMTAVRDETIKITTLALNLSAFFSMFGVIFINAAKTALGEEQSITPFNAMAAVLYPLYVAPNIMSAVHDQTEWFNIGNDVVTGVSMLKTWADNITTLQTHPGWEWASPWLEGWINLLWLAPPIGNMIHDPTAANTISLAGNLMFDVGGMLTPLVVVDGKIANEGLWLITQLLSFIYGLCSLGYGIAQMFGSADEAVQLPES